MDAYVQILFYSPYMYSFVTGLFLLSEHLLCKESIVIVKKIDFQISIFLCVFRAAEFIYAIFAVMHVYVCVCVCVRI